jgi:hypothetical protein
MEAIIAYNYLFQSKIVQDDKVFMEEKTNELARSLALYEIRPFQSHHEAPHAGDWLRVSVRSWKKSAVCSTARTYGVRSTPHGGYQDSELLGLQVHCVSGVMSLRGQ